VTYIEEPGFTKLKAYKEDTGYNSFIEIKFQKEKMNVMKVDQWLLIKKYEGKFIKNPYLKDWKWYVKLDSVLELSGWIVPGFKWGSKELGVPTANIEMNDANKKILEGHIPGVYLGNVTVRDIEYKASINYGWSPQYANN